MHRFVSSLFVLLLLFGIVLAGCESTKKAANVPTMQVPTPEQPKGKATAQ